MAQKGPADARGDVEREDDPGSFAARLNELFDTQTDSTGRRFTTEAIAARCSDLGTPISRAYLFHLRRGARTNPSPDKVEALAAAFGVTKSYFYLQGGDDSLGEVDAAVRVAMADPRVRTIALRAARLTPDVATVLDGVLASLERLPNALKAPTNSNGD